MQTPLIVPTEKEEVILRQLTVDDAPSFFEAIDANRDHLSQFDDDTAYKYPDLASVIDSIENPKNPDKLRMGIWDGDKFVGGVNLTPSADGTNAELGYWLDGRQIGKGYATIAAKALAAHAKQRFPKIHADVAEGNDSSIRVLERAGFYQTAREAGNLIFELVDSK